jgi:hypothetical protein
MTNGILNSLNFRDKLYAQSTPKGTQTHDTLKNNLKKLQRNNKTVTTTCFTYGE